MTLSKRAVSFGLLAAIAFQGLVLVGEYVNAAYPLWVGQEVTLATRPVDPRSLLRGNYALLRYDIDTIPVEDLPADRRIRNGEMVYVALKADDNGVFRYAGATLEPPEDAPFIRGRMRTRTHQNEQPVYRITYGIEAYFAPKDKALALEATLRQGAKARIKLADNGKAALEEIIP